MSNFPWLTVTGAVPLVGALVIALTPGRSAPGSVADRRARDLLVKRIALVVHADHARASHRDRGAVLRRRPPVPVPAGLPVDPAVRRALRRRRRRHRAGADPDDHRADAGRHAGLLERRREPHGRRDARLRRRGRPGAGAGTDTPAVAAASRPAGAAQREVLLRHDAGARDDDDRGLRGHRRLPVLRVLRGHAGPDVLHDRELRRRAAAVRGRQVPALQPARRPADARRGDRAVRRVHARRPPGHVPVHAAQPPDAEPDHAAVAVPRLLHRVRDQGAAVAVPHLAAGRGGVGPAGGGGDAGGRAGQGRHLRHDPVLPGPVPERRRTTSRRWSWSWRSSASCTARSWRSASAT